MRVLITCFLLTISFCGFSQNEQSALQNNGFCISSDQEPPADFLALFRQVKDKYAFYALGECHHYLEGGLTEWYKFFLKFLYEEAGVRYYMPEMGYAEGLLWNKYLETGNEDYIKYNLKYSRRSGAKAFWEWLYEFNQQKSPEERIKVIGIDAERTYTYYEALAWLMPTGKIPSSAIQHSIQTILQKRDYYRENYKNDYEVYVAFYEKEIKSLAKDFDKHKKEYQNFFGDNYTDAERIITNHLRPTKMMARDKGMYKKIVQYSKQNKKEDKYFGDFGSWHTQLYNRTINSSTMYFLNKRKSSSFRNKVMTINMYCLDVIRPDKTVFPLLPSSKSIIKDIMPLSLGARENQECPCSIINTPGSLSGNKISSGAHFLLFLKNRKIASNE